ncbi:restriction endonuclease subunit S [Thiopseudomonas acetoxidans]|uniref:Restriction endonuclease subunit S n=1 Tax=Thiopseudomonas acetoxidans TaxID=3041622 RepID=A0ABT7SMX4_9GAMM|nr:restriction endonuclease subunit S [Thiopseudomonas sp. CY1220]MDM7856874.1 restriction endonuclease subunit S [Thiopseudomonas sp. CY1220]
MSNSKGEFGTDGVVNKDLPQGWTLYPLEEVVEIHNSLRKPINASERSKRDGIYPYYGATGQVGWIDDFRQDGEYVLLGEDGAPFLDITKDKAYIVSGKCWVNNHAHVLKGQKGKCLNKYLLHSLNQTDFRSLVNGTTRLKLTQASLRKIPINLAPLDVQESIVAKIEELFSELDSGIASLKTAQEQLKIYRQSLLKHAFEGKLTEQWRKDNASKLETPEQLLARIQTERETRYQQQLEEWKQAVKDWEEKGKEGKRPSKPAIHKPLSRISAEELEVLPELPKEWSYIRLAEIAAINSGMSVSKNRKLADPIEVNYLRVANVQRGYLDLSEIKSMNIEMVDLPRLQLEINDVLFNEGGDLDKLGRGWIWEGQVSQCITQNHVFRASPFVNEKYHAKFISYWGNSFGRDYFESGGKQTTNLASINKTVLSNFPIPLTSFTEQKEIVNQLEEKLSIIEQNEKEIERALAKAELLRQSILKKAFSGKLILTEE